MEIGRLIHLRKKQFAYFNLVTGVGAFGLSFMLYYFTFGMVVSILGMSTLLSGIFMLYRNEDLLCIFPGMKELWEYERKKSGKVFTLNMRVLSIIYILLGGAFLWKGFAFPDVRLPSLLPFPSIYFGTFFLLILLANLAGYIHIRKTDKKATDEIQKKYLRLSTITLIMTTAVGIFSLLS